MKKEKNMAHFRVRNFLYLANILLIQMQFCGLFRGVSSAELSEQKNELKTNRELLDNEFPFIQTNYGLTYNMIAYDCNKTVCYENIEGCWPALNNTVPVKQLRIEVNTDLLQSNFSITPIWNIPDGFMNKIAGFHVQLRRLNKEQHLPEEATEEYCQQYLIPNTVQQKLKKMNENRNITFQCRDCINQRPGRYILTMWSLFNSVHIIDRTNASDNFLIIDIRQHCLECVSGITKMAVIIQNRSCEKSADVTLYTFPTLIQWHYIQLYSGDPKTNFGNLAATQDICMPMNRSWEKTTFTKLKENTYEIAVIPGPFQKRDGTLCNCHCYYNTPCLPQPCTEISNCPYVSPRVYFNINPKGEINCEVKEIPIPLTQSQISIIILSCVLIIFIIIIIIISYLHPPIVRRVNLLQVAAENDLQIFLLYADESECSEGNGEHKKNVHALKHYIERNLTKKVITDMDDECLALMKEDLVKYFTDSATNSHAIVIVDSERVRFALNATSTNSNQKENPEVQLILQNDNQFLAHMLRNLVVKNFYNSLKGRILVVRFNDAVQQPRTHCPDLNRLGRSYNLPKNIDDFMMDCAGVKTSSWPFRYIPGKTAEKDLLLKYNKNFDGECNCEAEHSNGECVEKCKWKLEKPASMESIGPEVIENNYQLVSVDNLISGDSGISADYSAQFPSSSGNTDLASTHKSCQKVNNNIDNDAVRDLEKNDCVNLTRSISNDSAMSTKLHVSSDHINNKNNAFEGVKLRKKTENSLPQKNYEHFHRPENFENSDEESGVPHGKFYPPDMSLTRSQSLDDVTDWRTNEEDNSSLANSLIPPSVMDSCSSLDEEYYEKTCNDWNNEFEKFSV